MRYLHDTPPSQSSRHWRAMTVRRYLVVTALLLITHLAPAAGGQGIDNRLGVGHTAGELVGLDDGYTRFDLFLALTQPTDDSLLFGDVRFLLFNEQTEADGANIGLGGRAYDAATDRILGSYFYYDYRDTGYSHYNQLAWGFESLGRVWDGRVSAYLPLGDTWNNYIDHATPTKFIGTHMFYSDIQQEVALRGVDSELMALLLDRGWWQVRGGGGIYSYWHANAGVSAVGPKVRLELRVADQLWIGTSVQHDDEFDTTAAVSVSWRYGLSRHFAHCPSSESVRCRLGDPVQRNEQVAIKRFIGGPSTLKVVRAPDGDAYTFHHVDSNAANGGDGSIESPTNNLADASNQPDDIVLVHGGSEFVGQSFVTTTEGQRVLAEGVEHLLETKRLGTVALPMVTSGPAPVIRDTPIDAITVAADGVEISGFEIIDPGLRTPTPWLLYVEDEVIDIDWFYPTFVPASGIAASDVGDISINRNVVTGATGSGIATSELKGENRIESNAASSNWQDGISVAGDYSGILKGNLAENNVWRGIHAGGNVVGDVAENYTALNGTGGIVVEGNVDGHIRGNTADGNSVSGIRIDGEVTGSVIDNLVTDTTEVQFITHTSSLYLIDYSVDYFGTSLVIVDPGSFRTDTSNQGTGIEVSDGILGDVARNEVLLNDGYGLHVEGDVEGHVQLNVANENSGTGLHIKGTVYGDAFENEAIDNGDKGIVTDMFMGDLVGNVAINNANGGVLTSAVLGDRSNNVIQEVPPDGESILEVNPGKIFLNSSPD